MTANLTIGGKYNDGQAIDLSSTDYTAPAECPNGEFNVYVGTAGALKVDLVSGRTVVMANAVATYHVMRVKKVYKVGTTASNMMAFWNDLNKG